MKENNRGWYKVVGALIVGALIATVTLAPVRKQGQSFGKYVAEYSSETLATETTLTGTAFKVQNNLGYMSYGFQITQGTSTPYYYAEIYGSMDGSNYTTAALATITASNNETSTDLKIVTISIPLCNYARIDWTGATGNATNTAVTAWRMEQ